MSEVYLAQDTTLDRKVALKFLPEELDQDSTARKRFLREAQAGSCQSPVTGVPNPFGHIVEQNSFIGTKRK